jgi:hypothetical protein
VVFPTAAIIGTVLLANRVADRVASQGSDS